MVKIPMPSPLERLAVHVFPDYKFLTREDQSAFKSMRNRLAEPSPERVAEFEAWWAAHSLLPPDEIRRLLAIEEERAKVRLESRAQLKEAQRFFNQQPASCDYQHWARMAHWSIDEAIALSLGKNPKIVNWEAVKLHVLPDFDGFISPFALEYERRLQVARRAIPWKKLFDPVLPSIFIRWAERQDYSFPAELRALIDARGSIVDWQDIATTQRDTIASLESVLSAQREAAKTLKEQAGALESELSDLRLASQETQARLTKALAEIELLRNMQTSASAEQPKQAWPWGSHDTELLQQLAAAATKWWVNVDPTDNTTAPTNQQVQEWLEAQNLPSGRPVGRRVAEIMAQMLRADRLPPGPR